MECLAWVLPNVRCALRSECQINGLRSRHAAKCILQLYQPGHFVQVNSTTTPSISSWPLLIAARVDKLRISDKEWSSMGSCRGIISNCTIVAVVHSSTLPPPGQVRPATHDPSHNAVYVVLISFQLLLMAVVTYLFPWRKISRIQITNKSPSNYCTCLSVSCIPGHRTEAVVPWRWRFKELTIGIHFISVTSSGIESCR